MHTKAGEALLVASVFSYGIVTPTIEILSGVGGILVERGVAMGYENRWRVSA